MIPVTDAERAAHRAQFAADVAALEVSGYAAALAAAAAIFDVPTLARLNALRIARENGRYAETLTDAEAIRIAGLDARRIEHARYLYRSGRISG